MASEPGSKAEEVAWHDLAPLLTELELFCPERTSAAARKLAHAVAHGCEDKTPSARTSVIEARKAFLGVAQADVRE